MKVFTKKSQGGVCVTFYRNKKFIDAKNDSANVIVKYLI